MPHQWLSLWFGLVMFLGAFSPGRAQSGIEEVVSRRWFESRSQHFHTFSCGSTQDVARLTARLEQFRQAYGALAGTQAVASPPIVVMAFPDHASLRPFLPLYQGQPANLSAFFSRGVDENLIALSLTGESSNALGSIFHEYAHLLFRHNDLFWPMWLKEGMAEIYSTFEVNGERSVRIGLPMTNHLRRLSQESMRPLSELFAVTRQSPQYNEREHQGIFYAQSWLLTHCLMLGPSPGRQARFAQLTALLRQGQSPEQAFTNAFQISLQAMSAELRRYLDRGQFRSLELAVKAELLAPRPLTTRGLGPAEICFRLGDLLLRLDRLEEADALFGQAQRLAPASSLGFEGLGLLAAERRQPTLAITHLKSALRLGSKSFLVHYVFARETFRLAAPAPDRFVRLEKEAAAEIRTELGLTLSLMPDFGPAHHLLGFLELVQGEDLPRAIRHLETAIRLEPENQAYALSLAQAQIAAQNPSAARRTLQELSRPSVDASLRQAAAELLRTLPAN